MECLVEQMWRGQLAMISVVVLAVQIPFAFAPASNPQVTGPPLVVSGTTACYLSGQACTFTAYVMDSSLVLFRWDLDDDGAFEFPGPVQQNWTPSSSVVVTPSNPVYDPAIPQVCAQGWDGFTVDSATHLPIGPISCSNPSVVVLGTLRVDPRQWSRHSMGQSVTVTLVLPAEVDPEGVNTGSVTLEGIPANPFYHGGWHTIGGGATEWRFKVDRTMLTEKLGPGVHAVRLIGSHAGGTFTATAEVTIL